MYTEAIGQRALDTWRAQTGEQLSARAFFDRYFYPLFFDDARLLQWVSNSPFTRPNLSRAQQLAELHALVHAATQPGGRGLDLSLAPGFPAAGTTATTAGQVSDRAPAPDEETAYRAWLGAGLGVGVAGGLCLSFEEPVVIEALLEGWPHYRALLASYPALKGNQVETWNGQWLAHRFSPAYDPTLPLAGLDAPTLLGSRGAGCVLPTHAWVSLLFRLSQVLPDTTAYVYSLGQTNTTVGFVLLRLGEIASLRELAHRLFTLDGSGEQWALLSQAYETRVGLGRACETGVLGLHALEPASLRQALASPPTRARNPTQARQQQLFILWITAMLNSLPAAGGPSTAELTAAATRLAESLRSYAAHEPGKQKGRGKTNFMQLVEGAFVSSVPAFIESLTKMLAASPAGADYREVFLEAVTLASELPQPRYKLYQSLLRFNYVAS